jgi:hypothetical protein
MPYYKGRYLTDSEFKEVCSNLTHDEEDEFRRRCTISPSSRSSGDFLISAAIGAATGSTLLGGLLGGDIIGGAVGDLLEGGGLFD